VAAQFGVHPTLIHDWKKKLLAGAAGLFEGGAKAAAAPAEGQQAELFEQTGRLKMELEWLKKSCRLPVTGSGSRSSRSTPS
jgi:transposase-like protein